MKLTKLLMICTSLIIFTPTVVKGEINLQTDNSRILINSQGGMTLSTKKSTVNLSSPNNPNYANFWSRFRDQRTTRQSNYSTSTCSIRQSTTIVGSSRQVRQSNGYYCK